MQQLAAQNAKKRDASRAGSVGAPRCRVARKLNTLIDAGNGKGDSPMAT